MRDSPRLAGSCRAKGGRDRASIHFGKQRVTNCRHFGSCWTVPRLGGAAKASVRRDRPCQVGRHRTYLLVGRGARKGPPAGSLRQTRRRRLRTKPWSSQQRETSARGGQHSASRYARGLCNMPESAMRCACYFCLTHTPSGKGGEKSAVPVGSWVGERREGEGGAGRRLNHHRTGPLHRSPAVETIR